jgi:hypothetical protein
MRRIRQPHRLANPSGTCWAGRVCNATHCAPVFGAAADPSADRARRRRRRRMQHRREPMTQPGRGPFTSPIPTVQAKTAALPAGSAGPRSVAGELAVPSAELERYVRVGVERVGEGDPMVAVRDVPFCDENRRQAIAGQDFLQVVQHARIRQ